MRRNSWNISTWKAQCSHNFNTMRISIEAWNHEKGSICVQFGYIRIYIFLYYCSYKDEWTAIKKERGNPRVCTRVNIKARADSSQNEIIIQELLRDWEQRIQQRFEKYPMNCLWLWLLRCEFYLYIYNFSFFIMQPRKIDFDHTRNECEEREKGLESSTRERVLSVFCYGNIIRKSVQFMRPKKWHEESLTKFKSGETSKEGRIFIWRMMFLDQKRVSKIFSNFLAFRSSKDNDSHAAHESEDFREEKSTGSERSIRRSFFDYLKIWFSILQDIESWSNMPKIQ